MEECWNLYHYLVMNKIKFKTIPNKNSAERNALLIVEPIRTYGLPQDKL